MKFWLSSCAAIALVGLVGCSSGSGSGSSVKADDLKGTWQAVSLTSDGKEFVADSEGFLPMGSSEAPDDKQKYVVSFDGKKAHETRTFLKSSSVQDEEADYHVDGNTIVIAAVKPDGSPGEQRVTISELTSDKLTTSHDKDVIKFKRIGPPPGGPTGGTGSGNTNPSEQSVSISNDLIGPGGSKMNLSESYSTTNGERIFCENQSGGLALAHTPKGGSSGEFNIVLTVGGWEPGDRHAYVYGTAWYVTGKTKIQSSTCEYEYTNNGSHVNAKYKCTNGTLSGDPLPFIGNNSTAEMSGEFSWVQRYAVPFAGRRNGVP